MKNSTYKCDICGKEKGEVNHWFIVIRGVDIAEISKNVGCKPDFLLGQSFEKIFLVFQWNDELAKSEFANHACGQDHVGVLASRWMHDGTLDKPMTEKAAV